MRDYAAEARRYMDANPAVWGLFCLKAEQLVEHGWRRHSARAIFHIIRLELKIEMNNLWSATFARRWLDEHPDYPDFFELRGADGLPDSRQADLWA